MKTAYAKAVQFFASHAGYSYDPKTETKRQGKMRCARKLAKAEQHAASMGWGYEWTPDENGCSGCDCGSADCDCSTGAEHETLGCVLRDDAGNVLASLWGICGAHVNDYDRVVEAELALEAMA